MHLKFIRGCITYFFLGSNSIDECDHGLKKTNSWPCPVKGSGTVPIMTLSLPITGLSLSSWMSLESLRRYTIQWCVVHKGDSKVLSCLSNNLVYNSEICPWRMPDALSVRHCMEEVMHTRRMTEKNIWMDWLAARYIHILLKWWSICCKLQWMNVWMNESTDQPTNQSTNQPINQSINQSTDRPISNK